MDLDPEWKKEAVEKHLQEEELKVEKNYLLNLCSKNDQIQEPKPQQRFSRNFKKKKDKYKIFYYLFR